MRLPARRLAAGLLVIATLASCGSEADTAAEPAAVGSGVETTEATTPSRPTSTTAAVATSVSVGPDTTAAAEIDPADLALFTLLGKEVSPVFLDDYLADPQTALDEATADGDRFCRIAEDSQATDATEQWATGVYIVYIGLPKKTRDLYGSVEGYGTFARILLVWRCPDQAERILGP